MADFGGFMRFTYDSSNLRMRGKFDTEPTDSSFKEVNNQDGSIDRTQEPMAHKAKVTFVDTDDSDNTNATPTSLPWNDIMKGGGAISPSWRSRPASSTPTRGPCSWGARRWTGSRAR